MFPSELMFIHLWLKISFMMERANVNQVYPHVLDVFFSVSM